jgi:hypothetical protein
VRALMNTTDPQTGELLSDAAICDWCCSCSPGTTPPPPR